jgi:predicted enzyme related to lactoylglutathione lyase
MGKDNGTIPRALVLLKPYLADVIIFKYYCGMKNKDIALLFQIDEKLVKSRLYEARKKLKGFISQADAAGSPLEASELIKERLKIMENMNFVAKGAYVFSRMSLKEQLDLYEQIKKDGNITGEVLTAIGQIKQGKDFLKECRSEIVYTEFIKILLYCNQFVSSQFVGGCADGELIKKDMHKALETEYDIEAVEVWLFVENIEETINWYGKALGWNGGVDAYSNEGEAVFGCVYNGKEEPISEGYRNSYAICLMKGIPAEEQKHFIFIVVSDINKVFDKLKDAGAKILYPVKKEPWGMYTFSALDLNGYHLKIAQRI